MKLRQSGLLTINWKRLSRSNSIGHGSLHLLIVRIGEGYHLPWESAWRHCHHDLSRLLLWLLDLNLPSIGHKPADYGLTWHGRCALQKRLLRRVA